MNESTLTKQPQLSLLESLKGVPWIVASRVYGNTHDVLVGLLVNWWIISSPETRWATSGASFGHRSKGIGGGICDSLFGEGKDVVAVLEVEGTRGKATAEKIGKYFAAELDEYQTLKFAILLLYAYKCKGQGIHRTIESAHDAETFEEVARVSALYPQKSIILITLDKKYERQKEGIRKHNEYYFSSASLIKAFLFEQGKEITAYQLFG